MLNDAKEIMYAICDGNGEGETKFTRSTSNVSTDADLSDVYEQTISYRMVESMMSNGVYNASGLSLKHVSPFPNRSRWWSSGSIRYGGRLPKLTEEIIERAFVPVYRSEADNVCPICLDSLLSNLISLSGCSHVYHRPCFIEYVTKTKIRRIICPLCSSVSFIGKGPSPPGKMSWAVKKDMVVLNDGVFVTLIEIKYKMRSGVQLRWHPSPGRPYMGTVKRAFLPVTADYILILKMLIAAFMDGQTFKVEQANGKSHGKIIWNGIEHKTSVTGGMANGGYPDNDYKKRVTANIISKGVTFTTLY
ncbi:hypothetical protein BEWA_022630 [Theileria equi strain WA]|uniref:RING-type E3 ubiquitin transferase n=1 Tax=Theileria equi strain WA TaxID=1537102 RepID=L0AV53_THEEQ|nr:hypothetical protein BEWA_022630 [Theileria equi strain WA]AFZ79415.1 hypothetical protein BEWA_022630 [Theileria equi strain WA]|eukprot:XP_004829081.1 hypothetical protein BEWA_022630 [Theileria equi strain WA]